MRLDRIVGTAKSALGQVDGPVGVAGSEPDVAGTDDLDGSAVPVETGRGGSAQRSACDEIVTRRIGSRSIITVDPAATADAAAATRTSVILRSSCAGAEMTRWSSNIETITVGSGVWAAGVSLSGKVALIAPPQVPPEPVILE